MFSKLKSKLVDLLTFGHKSKTVVFGYWLLLIAGVQDYLPNFSSVLGAHLPLLTGIVGLVVVALRLATSMPLGDK